jgi:hypothetical protein
MSSQKLCKAFSTLVAGERSDTGVQKVGQQCFTPAGPYHQTCDLYRVVQRQHGGE